MAASAARERPLAPMPLAPQLSRSSSASAAAPSLSLESPMTAAIAAWKSSVERRTGARYTPAPRDSSQAAKVGWSDHCKKGTTRAGTPAAAAAAEVPAPPW
eukprot:scaffold8847_cov112-Isochrysis_galbana.AAC.5